MVWKDPQFKLLIPTGEVAVTDNDTVTDGEPRVGLTVRLLGQFNVGGSLRTEIIKTGQVATSKSGSVNEHNT
jgi:hypothetical protein